MTTPEASRLRKLLAASFTYVGKVCTTSVTLLPKFSREVRLLAPDRLLEDYSTSLVS